jgi:hypothetical protein
MAVSILIQKKEQVIKGGLNEDDGVLQREKKNKKKEDRKMKKREWCVRCSAHWKMKISIL